MTAVPAARIAALSALVALGAAAASPVHAAKAPAKKPKTHVVGVTSDFYDPERLTLTVGDTIKWVWHPTGFALHDVAVDSGPERFSSPSQASGTFLHRFKKAGKYKLYCTQHESMRMTVTVKKRPR